MFLTSQKDYGNIGIVVKKTKLVTKHRKGGALMIKECVRFSVISRPGGLTAD
jgi:hypothetical protein